MPKPPRTWVISDTHFGHANIIRHGERPFDTVDEMDETLVSNWNTAVRENDTVYHLGDLCGPRMDSRVEEIAEQLHGRIVLITGNHDRITPRIAATLARVTGPQRLQTRGKGVPGVVLSHVPVHNAGTDEPGRIKVVGNLHGHIHQRTSPTPLHCNVCVEHTGYRPIRLEEAIERLSEQIRTGRPRPVQTGCG